ncbi:phosphatase PAP2 family protein [Sulfuricurvum sp.]|uniref:phosphatase PAP2 family protein n=1 Tax=Sulfuricurvum sp. TaxID=2025608 RepID=UPI00356710A6
MIPNIRLLLTGLSVIAIIFSYLFIDQTVATWSHSHILGAYHELFTTITEFGDALYYLVGFSITSLLFRYVWKKYHWANITFFLFSVVAASGISADIIKWIAGRYRPSELFAHGLYGFDFLHIDRALTSFPSGHTATAFALATAITYLWPKATPVWLFAVLIGISRLMICAHYPSDVIAGAFVGTASTLIVIRFWNPTTSKWLQPLKF